MGLPTKTVFLLSFFRVLFVWFGLVPSRSHEHEKETKAITEHNENSEKFCRGWGRARTAG